MISTPFTVRGRVVYADGSPAHRVWVSVVDVDRDDVDDLLGVALTHQDGGFELAFLWDALAQDPGEIETRPELYAVLSLLGDAAPLPVSRHELGVLPDSGVLNAVTLVLPLAPGARPQLSLEVFHAPAALPHTRRIRLTDPLVALAAREVAPIVSELTGWPDLLAGIRIVIADSMVEAMQKAAAASLGRSDLGEVERVRLEQAARRVEESYVAIWEPALDTIFLNRRALELGSLDTLKLTLGHELVHVGQNRYHPELDVRVREILDESQRAQLAGEEWALTQAQWRILANLEGYAHYIETKYLLAVYTSGHPIAIDVGEEAMASQTPWQRAVGRSKADPPESPQERQTSPRDDLEFFRLDKASQYESGLAAYVARTTHRPARFDPDLAPTEKLSSEMFATLRVRAKEGCALSNEILGFLYTTGQGGMPQNLAIAQLHFRKAAENGMARAAYPLALLLPPGAERTRWLRVAAIWGMAEAQHQIGNDLLRRDGPHYAPDDAVAWLERAAEQGHVPSLEALATVFLVGDGVPRNIDASLRWSLRAAEAGSVRSMRRVAAAYAGGVGLPKDAASALAWTQRADAAQQGKTRSSVRS